jgi:threonine dehydratase
VLPDPARGSPGVGVSEARSRLKLETLQPTFSYKIRGAFSTILRLIENIRAGDSRS